MLPYLKITNIKNWHNERDARWSTFIARTDNAIELLVVMSSIRHDLSKPIASLSQTEYSFYLYTLCIVRIFCLYVNYGIYSSLDFPATTRITGCHATCITPSSHCSGTSCPQELSADNGSSNPCIFQLSKFAPWNETVKELCKNKAE